MFIKKLAFVSHVFCKLYGGKSGGRRRDDAQINLFGGGSISCISQPKDSCSSGSSDWFILSGTRKYLGTVNKIIDGRVGAFNNWVTVTSKVEKMSELVWDHEESSDHDHSDYQPLVAGLKAELEEETQHFQVTEASFPCFSKKCGSWGWGLGLHLKWRAPGDTNI